jgi:hypothetical protein
MPDMGQQAVAVRDPAQANCKAKSGFACCTKRTAKQKTNDRWPGIPGA